MGIGSGLNQLNVHPNGVATLLYASFQNVRYAKLLCDFAAGSRVRSYIAASRCGRLLLDRRCWRSGLEFHPECYRQSTHSLCLRCDFQTEGLQCFCPGRHSAFLDARKRVQTCRETMADAAARATRVRRTLRTSGEQRCRRAANSLVPGREAGSNASIDSSSDFRRCGTCAALSCSTGSTFDCCARWISSTVRPANGVFPVSANQSVSPSE